MTDTSEVNNVVTRLVEARVKAKEDELGVEIAKLKEENDTLKKENDTLKEENGKQAKAIAVLEKEVAHLRFASDELQEERKAADKLETVARKAENKLEVVNGEKDEAKAWVAVREEELAEARGELAQEREKRAALEKQLEELRGKDTPVVQANGVAAPVGGASEANGVATPVGGAGEASGVAARDGKAEVEAELEKARSDVKALEAKVKVLEVERDAAVAAGAAKASDEKAEAELAEVRGEKDKLAEQLAAVRGGKAEVDKRLVALEQELEGCRESLERERGRSEAVERAAAKIYSAQVIATAEVTKTCAEFQELLKRKRDDIVYDDDDGDDEWVELEEKGADESPKKRARARANPKPPAKGKQAGAPGRKKKEARKAQSFRRPPARKVQSTNSCVDDQRLVSFMERMAANGRSGDDLGHKVMTEGCRDLIGSYNFSRLPRGSKVMDKLRGFIVRHRVGDIADLLWHAYDKKVLLKDDDELPKTAWGLDKAVTIAIKMFFFKPEEGGKKIINEVLEKGVGGLPPPRKVEDCTIISDDSDSSDSSDDDESGTVSRPATPSMSPKNNGHGGVGVARKEPRNPRAAPPAPQPAAPPAAPPATA